MDLNAFGLEEHGLLNERLKYLREQGFQADMKQDIWEANSISAAYTPHPCQPEAYTPCTGDSCTSTCDQAGCDFNSYRMGNTTFYGPGKTIDTTKKFTVVTQFLTSDGTASGDLTEIKRFYVQNGVTYANSQSDIAGVTGNSLTSDFCDAQKTAFGDSNTFKAEGGLKAMGEAFKAGMTLVLSIWDDTAVNMLWLDAPYPTTAPTTNPGVVRGTCSVTSGKPADVESQTPGATVVFSNIKTGPIGSTFNSAGTGGSGSTTPPKSSSSSAAPPPSSTKSSSTSSVKPPPSTTTTPTKTTTTSKPATSPTGATAAHYGQCGGQGYVILTGLHITTHSLTDIFVAGPARPCALARTLARSPTPTTASVCKRLMMRITVAQYRRKYWLGSGFFHWAS